MQNEKEHWAFDKRVPVALIMTIIFQTGGIVWWARGQVEKDVEFDRRLLLLEDARKTDHVGERLAVLEAQTSNIGRTLERIEQRLQAQQEESLPPFRKRNGKE